jgi:hypothetical protein
MRATKRPKIPHEYRVHRHAPQRRQGFWLAAAKGKPVEMARYCPSLLLRRRRPIAAPSLLRLLIRRSFASSPSNPPSPSAANPASSKPPALSARLTFVFDQLDALDRSRSSDLSARDAALRRIQSWRRPPPLRRPPWHRCWSRIRCRCREESCMNRRRLRLCLRRLPMRLRG